MPSIIVPILLNVTAQASEPETVASGLLGSDLYQYDLYQAPSLLQDTGSTSAPVRSGTGGVKRTRDHLMQLNFRGKYLAVPDSIMDFWFYDEDDDGANPFKRPTIRGYALGLEYALNPYPANWFFYAEYIGNLMGEGYWDDVEDTPDHDDGDWMRPTNFGVWAVGANVARQVDIVKPQGGSASGVTFSFMAGGGVGFGIVTGELTQWNPGGNEGNTDITCLEASPAYDRVNSCPDDGPKRVPGVVPIADISLGLRLGFGDRANVRIEGGLHDAIYMGAASGVVF